MPAEYLPLWESTSTTNKDMISRQAKLYRLESDYQIKNFWQTRGLGKPVNDVAASINESQTRNETPAPESKLGYSNDYVKAVAERLKK
jgi:hypothetical protein